MKNSRITFFPVGDKNGGMTLIRLNDTNSTTVLMDCSINVDSVAHYCDVSEELIKRLPRDSDNRPYVDAFILSHRDQDHLQGFQDHFYLGKLDEYGEVKGDENNKIIIREMWSTYNFWKRASSNYNLCDDAKAFNKEMRRRVDLFEDSNAIQEAGDRCIIVGKDPSGKTEALEDINYEIGANFSKINNLDISPKLSGLILGPIEQQDEEDDDCFSEKNRQSIILQLIIKESDSENKILLTADAECFVWETLWEKYKNEVSKLKYHIMTAPHHCSWHSISYDSQSNDEDPQVCNEAKSALSQCESSAFIVSQSKPIKSNDQDPPSKAAKDEYLTIVNQDHFQCTNEYPDEKKPEPLEFNLTSGGPQKVSIKAKSKTSQASRASTKESYPHG